jgi:hypothetical protein
MSHCKISCFEFPFYVLIDKTPSCKSLVLILVIKIKTEELQFFTMKPRYLHAM